MPTQDPGVGGPVDAVIDRMQAIQAAIDQLNGHLRALAPEVGDALAAEYADGRNDRTSPGRGSTKWPVDGADGSRRRHLRLVRSDQIGTDEHTRRRGA